MSIIKLARRENDFLLMQKDSINNKTLSFAARGLHAYLMSKPNDWTVMTSELINASPQGKDAIYSLLTELINAGYIERAQGKSSKGRFGRSNYIVYETCQLSVNRPLPAFPDTVVSPLPDLPDTAYPLPAKPPLLSINSTKDLKNKAEAGESDAAAFISTSLTTAQKLLISKRIALLSNLKGHEIDLWQSAIEAELLDVSSFKKAKQLFDHKLNIVFQQEKIGKWSPSLYIAQFQQIHSENALRKVDALQHALKKLLLEKPGLEKSITLHQNNPTSKESFERALKKLNENIQNLNHEILLMNNSISSKEAA